MSTVEKSSPSPAPQIKHRAAGTYGPTPRPTQDPTVARSSDVADDFLAPDPHPAAPSLQPALPRQAAPPPPLLAQFHTLRRVAGKISRKLKRTLGRPDAAPWILRPRTGRRSTAFVDVLVSLDYLSPNSTLVHLLHEALAARGLSVLLVNDRNVEDVISQLETGWLRPHLSLDLCSAANARYFDLLHSSEAAGAYTVGNPRRLLEWTLKSSSHPRLECAGGPAVLHQAGQRAGYNPPAAVIH